MRAAVLRELNTPLTLEDVDLAEPGLGEVGVRLAASGVCHSDWNVVTGVTPESDAGRPRTRGRRRGRPAVLGHEGAGVVETVGEGVTAVSEGDHVVLSWLPACGRCLFCRQGRPVLCENAFDAMFDGTLPSGALRLSQDGQPLYHYSYLST